VGRAVARALPPCFLLLGLASSHAARAADEGLVLRSQAAQLAAEGRCDEALPQLARARALSPQDPAAALLQGECLLQAGRYAEAIPPLEDASRLDPSSADAALYLGMARYHAGNPEAADQALARAEELAPDNAEVALYRGLALLDLARADEATERFYRASRIDPAGVEPIASYYAGVAEQSAGRAQEAEAALRHVSELAPGSEWDRQARAALAGAATTARSYRLRRWLVLLAGLAYDSNVALIGTDVAQPGSISHKSDGRGEWGVQGGHELFRNETWSGGVLANYDGNAYFRESDFDLAYVGAGAWVERALGESTRVQVQPLFGAIYYDYDDYLRFYGCRADAFHGWGDAGTGDLWVRYAYNNFLYPIPGATPALRDARNRDGSDVWTGYDHRYPLTPTTTLQGGPFVHYYHSRGTEYDYWGIGAWIGVRQQLPWELTGDVSGSYGYDHYRHSSTFLLPGEKIEHRRDDVWIVQGLLERPITKRVTATARWTYYNDDSNTDVFSYDRHVVGLYITVAFGD
jgi:tetratricopeptide (TPR) repeat protein